MTLYIYMYILVHRELIHESKYTNKNYYTISCLTLNNILLLQLTFLIEE
jgi:hypothetical protein